MSKTPNTPASTEAPVAPPAPAAAVVPPAPPAADPNDVLAAATAHAAAISALASRMNETPAPLPNLEEEAKRIEAQTKKTVSRKAVEPQAGVWFHFIENASMDGRKFSAGEDVLLTEYQYEGVKDVVVHGKNPGNADESTDVEDFEDGNYKILPLLGQLNHNGIEYTVGDTVHLTREQAVPLHPGVAFLD